jgi:hypothetical protein
MRAVLVLLPALLASAPSQEEGFVPLFNGKDWTGWTHHLRKGKDGAEVKMEEVWSIADGVITCKGTPPGYIRTTTDYKDFVLKLQWRFEKAGNSGVLVRMTGDDKVWPKSCEAQLASGRAGDFWLIDGFKLETPKERVDPKAERHRNHAKANEKPVGEWNDYEITADGGRISLKVNGEVLNEGTGGDEVAGKICLQSEGAVIQFRHIRLKPLGK